MLAEFSLRQNILGFSHHYLPSRNMPVFREVVVGYGEKRVQSRGWEDLGGWEGVGMERRECSHRGWEDLWGGKGGGEWGPVAP